MDSVGAKIGVKGNDLSPWYKLDQRAFTKLGLGSLLRFRSFSQYALLTEVYPEYDWLPWMFKKLPNHVGRDPEILRKAVTFVETEKQFTKPQDWYNISHRQLQQMGMLSIFLENGGICESLRLARPDFEWEPARFPPWSRKSSAQSTKDAIVNTQLTE